MHKLTLTVSVLAAFFLANTATAETCLKAYGTTPDEALKAGAELAERVDGSKHTLDANMTIRILPEKENGKFVAMVYPSLNRNFCPHDTDHRTAEATETADLNANRT